MALYKKIRALAVKHEAALGTGIATTVSDFEAWDVQYTPSIEMISRSDLGSLSPPADVPGQASGQVTFKTYLRPGAVAGAAPIVLERLMPMCGYAQALEVFSPSGLVPTVSGVLPTTGTISSYENGLQKTISGAMGTARIVMVVGQPIVFEWTFTGRYEGVGLGVAPVVDATLVTQTLTDAANIPMKFASSVLTIGGAAPGCIESLTIDLGNEVVLRPCATESTGFAHAVITGRRVTGSWNPESRVVATEDVHALWLAGTAEALSLTAVGVAADAGDTTLTIAAPQAQRTNVQPGERNGIQTDQIDFLCHKSATAGNDELTFSFA